MDYCSLIHPMTQSVWIRIRLSYNRNAMDPNMSLFDLYYQIPSSIIVSVYFSCIYSIQHDIYERWTILKNSVEKRGKRQVFVCLSISSNQPWYIRVAGYPNSIKPTNILVTLLQILFVLSSLRSRSTPCPLSRQHRSRRAKRLAERNCQFNTTNLAAAGFFIHRGRILHPRADIFLLWLIFLLESLIRGARLVLWWGAP